MLQRTTAARSPTTITNFSSRPHSSRLTRPTLLRPFWLHCVSLSYRWLITTKAWTTGSFLMRVAPPCPIHPSHGDIPSHLVQSFHYPFSLITLYLHLQPFILHSTIRILHTFSPISRLTDHSRPRYPASNIQQIRSLCPCIGLAFAPGRYLRDIIRGSLCSYLLLIF